MSELNKTELNKIDHAYLYYFFVGFFVLFLLFLQVMMGTEGLLVGMGILFIIVVPVTLALIYYSIVATVYAFTITSKDYLLQLLAIITIPYEILALDNVFFLFGVFVISDKVFINISWIYAATSVGISVLWYIIRRPLKLSH